MGNRTFISYCFMVGFIDRLLSVYHSPMFMRQQPMSTCNNETMMPMMPPLFKNETMMPMKTESDVHLQEHISMPDVSMNEILPMLQDTSDTLTDSTWNTTTKRRKSLESLHIPRVPLPHFSARFVSVEYSLRSPPP